jgi:hypothetical protein
MLLWQAVSATLLLQRVITVVVAVVVVESVAVGAAVRRGAVVARSRKRRLRTFNWNSTMKI